MSSVEAPHVESFRTEIRDWLRSHLTGEFGSLRGRGGPGREHEEYALADAPARVNHIGEQLLGPTLIAFGTPERRARFLPPILAVEELWCQGYSEPGAGSDLANVRTRAAWDEARGDWIVDGQKIWTSLAHASQWCFVVARTEPGSVRHRGLSYLLVPLDQPGVEIRPIVQLTGTSEFNEVFFDGARARHLVGEPGDGWRIAMATLGFERGVSTLGQQVAFRGHALRMLDIRGAAGTLATAEPYDFDDWQRLFLFSRADTLYAGSNEIQRNIIAERVLGLPKEARG